MFEGYSPLAKGQVLNNPTILQIAEKHRHTPAQICIRWSIQVVNGLYVISNNGLKIVSSNILTAILVLFPFFFFFLEWSCDDTKINQKKEDTRKLSSEL